jgi:hypothetical protein
VRSVTFAKRLLAPIREQLVGEADASVGGALEAATETSEDLGSGLQDQAMAVGPDRELGALVERQLPAEIDRDHEAPLRPKANRNRCAGHGLEYAIGTEKWQ